MAKNRDKYNFHKQHLPKQADYFIKPGQTAAGDRAGRQF